MRSSRKPQSTVGLDVEAGSVAAVEVSSNGSLKVSRTVVAPLDAGLVKEGEVMDAAALGEALKQLFAENKLSKTVRLGVANQRIAVRTLHMPLIENPSELETAVRFQAQEHIPMPLEHAVLDYRVVGRHNEGDGGRMEVVVVAARRDMIEPSLQAMRAAGLRPVGMDLSAFGMIRALAGSHQAVAPVIAEEGAEAIPPAPVPGAETPADAVGGTATAYCSLGDVTNLAVARGSACLFTRISPFGLETIASRLAERRGLALDHARSWLDHVGLAKPIEEIDGDVPTVQLAREALEQGASKLVDELRLSLEFYGTQEGASLIDGIVLCGAGSTIDGMPEALEQALGRPLRVASPRALGHLDGPDAARLTLSYGLALED
jgi:type IV pilus assembly protein PilM